jgi:glycosyltransferase involved in cell wall biosynthesis
VPGPRVLIVVENLSVPFDRRVWQESLALRRAGYRVAVICPQGRNQDREAHVTLEGVDIHRYSLREAGGGPATYIREYGAALWHSLRIALRLGRFDVVHICNPPDLLFLVALPMKLRGARIVFDQHDLVPELYLSRFGRGRDLLHRALLVCERLTYRLADAVITTNESYRAVAVTRGEQPEEGVFVVRSAPDTERFHRIEPDPELRRGRRYLLHYHGVMGPHDGVEYAVRALAALRQMRPEVDWHAALVGTGETFDDVVRLAAELGIDDCVSFPGRVPDGELLRHLSTADVAIAPDPLSPLNDVSTMNKVLEYMAVGLPIVSFDLRETRVSAGDAALYATPNDVQAFAAGIARLLDDPTERHRRGAIGHQRVTNSLGWKQSSASLIAGYEQVVAGGLPTRGNGGSDAHAD